MLIRYHFLAGVLFFLLVGHNSFAGKVDEEFIRQHLACNVYAIDSEADAIVLIEKRSINIHPGNSMYTQTEHVRKVIKILKPGGVAAADIRIWCPGDDLVNYVNNVTAVTYNLTGGKVEELWLDKKDVYKKKLADKQYLTSFSMPGVTAGSVIEFSYDVVTEFRRPIITWYIQEDYPKLATEFELIYPGKFEFTAITYVSDSVMNYASEADALLSPDNFCLVTANHASDIPMYSSCWIRKNVAAEKDEPYVQNIRNDLERLEVQVTGYMLPTNMIAHTNDTWKNINDYFWRERNFRNEINGKNKFLDEVMDTLVLKGAPAAENARRIFSYVRSNFTCDYDKSFSPGKSLESVFENKTGSEYEINLLLTAMLVRAGMDASPLILGTSSLISEVELFPVLDRFNYIACAVMIDGERVLLDASDKNNCFGMLPSYCYNGYAWMPGDEGSGIMLGRDMLTDRSVMAVKLSNLTDSSAEVEITEKLGLITSSMLRKSWVVDNKGEETYLRELEKRFNQEVRVLDNKTDNINAPDTNIISKYTCNIRFDEKVNTFFMNAILVKIFSANPFKSMERKLPIEFPYKTDFSYYMTVILPPGMDPDSLPKPTKITYNGTNLVFTSVFGLFTEMHAVSVRANYQVNATVFDKTDYKTLRYFFEKMLAANDELLSLKKAR